MPRQTRFIKSAMEPNDYPPGDRPEVAMIGRSNAGKSSLLNAIVGKKVAMVSQQPGKTRLLNFFDLGDHYRLVDMPGYGFAARSGAEVLAWEKMISRYFESRQCLAGFVLVMDARREWQEEEVWLKRWSEKLKIGLLLVLNKSDKLTRQEQNQIYNKFTQALPGTTIHLVSALKSIGTDSLEEDIFRKIIEPFGDTDGLAEED